MVSALTAQDKTILLAISGFYKIILTINLVLLGSLLVSGQSLSVSVPAIWTKVVVTNNYGPERQIKGHAWGYGIGCIYSFKNNGFLIRNKNLSVNIGAGYFKQQFNIERPFHYTSPVQPIFYTKKYSYRNFQGIVSLTYEHSLNNNFSLKGNLGYSWLHTFRQNYTPTFTYIGSVHFSQVEKKQYNFGYMITMSAGLSRSLSKRLSASVDLIVPLYIKWRKDRIFDDDPSKFFNPEFGVGGNFSLKYHFLKKNSP